MLDMTYWNAVVNNKINAALNIIYVIEMEETINGKGENVGAAFSLFGSVYLSLLPVAHLSNVPRRQFVITGDSARLQDETTESSALFFNVLGIWHCHMEPQFKVSS